MFSEIDSPIHSPDKISTECVNGRKLLTMYNHSGNNSRGTAAPERRNIERNKNCPIERIDCVDEKTPLIKNPKEKKQHTHNSPIKITK